METLDLASGRYLNETAIRSHALRCSQELKCGKFTRVGQDFIDEVNADVEYIIRELRGKATQNLFNAPRLADVCFTTGALMEKMETILNEVIARIIQRKVEKQPSRGVTLSRTR